MSYHEKQSIAAIVSNLVIWTIYAWIMVGRFPDGGASPEIFRFWGRAFLILIPVMIVARIITTIIFVASNTIATGEEVPSISDERDKLIELRGLRMSYYGFIAGFMGAMAALAFGATPNVMFLIIAGAMVGSDILEEITKFRLYRRGF